MCYIISSWTYLVLNIVQKKYIYIHIYISMYITRIWYIHICIYLYVTYYVSWNKFKKWDFRGNEIFQIFKRFCPIKFGSCRWFNVNIRKKFSLRCFYRNLCESKIFISQVWYCVSNHEYKLINHIKLSQCTCADIFSSVNQVNKTSSFIIEYIKDSYCT